jgi:hypothetical protein
MTSYMHNFFFNDELCTYFFLAMSYVHNFSLTNDHIIVFLTTSYMRNFSVMTNYAYNFFPDDELCA